MSIYRRDIDGLRAVAVTLVVLYHAGVAALPGGFLGVDVFFVISGFLISGIVREELDNGSFSLAQFYERRARRILPALFVMMGACFVAGWIILLPDAFEAFARSAAATTFFASNFWFSEAGKGYFSEASEYLPLLHTWSLAVEEQFYLLFPLMLVALAPRGRASTWRVVGGWTLASMALAFVDVQRWQSAAFYLMPMRAWELGLGALIALAPMPRLESRWSREFIAAAGLAAIVLAAFLVDGRSADAFAPGQHVLILAPAGLAPCLGAAALIITGAAGRTYAGALLSWRPMVFVGTISYSLYLWHWPILSFLRVRLQSVTLPWEWAVAAVAAAFALATLSWAFVERPFRQRGFLKRPAIFALSFGAMASAVAASALVFVAAGVPDRIPAAARVVAEAADDNNPRMKECFEPAIPDGVCRIGAAKAGPVDFLFWGDSHADALLPGMERAAQASGFSGLFVAYASCPPLLDVSVSSLPSCRARTDAVMDMLLRRHDVSTVILHARWALYDTGDYEEPGARMKQFIRLSDDRTTGAKTPANSVVFEDGLRRTVDAILKSGRHVVIVGDTPEIGWDVPGHLYLNARWGDRPPLPPSAAEVAARNARVTALFARLASDPRVAIAPLAATLCSDRCMVTFRGHPVFRDDDHVTAFASRELLAPVLIKDVFGRLRSAPWSGEADLGAVPTGGGAIASGPMPSIAAVGHKKFGNGARR